MRDELNQLVNNIKLRWANRPKSGWLFNTVSRFSEAVPFFVQSIDELMRFMQKFDMPGVSKKVVVMEAIGELYDYIIYPLLPIWLKPFSGSVKDLVLNVLISTFIDFLVSRLREVNPKAI